MIVPLMDAIQILMNEMQRITVFLVYRKKMNKN